MSHITTMPDRVDHATELYRSEREICSYQENRMREDRDFERNN